MAEQDRALEGVMSRQAFLSANQAVSQSAFAARAAAGLALVMEMEEAKMGQQVNPGARQLVQSDLEWVESKCAEAQQVIDQAQSVLDSAKEKAKELREFLAAKPDRH